MLKKISEVQEWRTEDRVTKNMQSEHSLETMIIKYAEEEADVTKLDGSRK